MLKTAKKVFSLFVILTMLSSLLITALGANDGVILFATFENGLDDFYKNGNSAVSRVTSEMHTGTASMAITARGGANDGVQADISGMESGSVYDISAWIKIPSGTPTTNAVLQFAIGGSNGDQYTWIKNMDVNGGTWTQLRNAGFAFTYSGTVTSVKLQIVTNGTNGATSEIYIDDIWILEQGTAVPSYPGTTEEPGGDEEWVEAVAENYDGGITLLNYSIYDSANTAAQVFAKTSGPNDSGSYDVPCLEYDNQPNNVSTNGWKADITGYINSGDEIKVSFDARFNGWVNEVKVFLLVDNGSTEARLDFNTPAGLTSAKWGSYASDNSKEVTFGTGDKVYLCVLNQSSWWHIDNFIIYKKTAGGGSEEKEPPVMNPAYDYFVFETFESGENNLIRSGEASLEVTDTEAYTGEQSLLVSDRTNDYDAVDITFAAGSLVLGKSYEISVWVKMAVKGNTAKIKLMNTDGYGTVAYNDTVGSDVWMNISGKFAATSKLVDGTGAIRIQTEASADNTKAFLVDDIYVRIKKVTATPVALGNKITVTVDSADTVANGAGNMILVVSDSTGKTLKSVSKAEAVNGVYTSESSALLAGNYNVKVLFWDDPDTMCPIVSYIPQNSVITLE